MAKDKERSINPAQQQRKLDKAKALKKGKAEVQARRNEKLARQNPDRLQRQVDELKALEASGQIKPREKQILEGLERDIRAVKKAREALGDKAPQFKKSNREYDSTRPHDSSNILGKRWHGGERKPSQNSKREESSGEETDESVRKIPMPRDTPPPIPHQFRPDNHLRNANHEPLTAPRLGDLPPALPVQPVQVVTTYSSAPQIRDLKREAISKFVPNVVRKKQEAVTGKAGLIEPEELDRLEAEGYTGKKGKTGPSTTDGRTTARGEEDEEEEDIEEIRRLEEEEKRFMMEVTGHNGPGVAEAMNLAEPAPPTLEADSTKEDLDLHDAAVDAVATENSNKPRSAVQEAQSNREDQPMPDTIIVDAAPSISGTSNPGLAGLAGLVTYTSDDEEEEEEEEEEEDTAVLPRTAHRPVEMEEVVDEDA